MQPLRVAMRRLLRREKEGIGGFSSIGEGHRELRWGHGVVSGENPRASVRLEHAECMFQELLVPYGKPFGVVHVG